MDRLGVLMSACQAVNTDKVTERKKQLDIIQRELLAKHVLEGLDTTTREKHSGRDEKIFTWDTLFLVAKDYMWKELATLQKAKSTATTQKKQQDLLAVHLELLIEHPKNFDCLLIAETICGLSRGVCEFCDPQARHILPKMLPFFADIKNEKSNFIINKIVKAATALCGQLAYDNRIGVCKFGEDVAKSLLWLLANSPADYLKHSVIEFLQVQMMCHHPGGARTAQEGAMAHDWDEWKSQLRKMYEVIYIQLQELQRQGKFLSNSELHGRQISWCDDFFCLAADVCQQMFADHASIVDVTQTSFMDAESGCTAAKKRRLQSGCRDLWSLFVPSQCPFHPEAIPFLSAFLHHHQLPEDYQPPVMGCVHQAYEGNYPLRLQLIDWLLPNQKDASDCSPQIIINTPSAELAHLLLCLCMRDTMGATSSYASTALHPLEDIFLKNSFIIPVYDSLKQEKKASTSERISSCLTGVYDKMISAIVQQTRLVLEQPKEAGRIEIFAWYASFIGNIMSEFLDVLSESSEIASILNDLLKKITQLFPDMKISAMDSVLIHLADLFHLCSSDKCLARLIHSATPDELLKKIMFLVFDAEKCTGNNNGSVRLTSCDFDDFDVDGNDVGTDQPDSEDSSSGLQSDHEGLLSTSMLSSKDAKRLRAVSLLCEWCCHGDGEKRIPPVMTKLLDLVDGEKDWFDVEEAFSLQAFQCLVEGLCSPVCSPSKDAIETLIQSMQISGKFHHTDPTIASAILNLMSVMLKRLNDSGEETTSNAYGNLKRLLMAFYKLSKDSLPSQCRESLANCMFTFVQLDPMANSADDGRLEICQILPDFLLDLSHRVRMTMAANMHCILMEEADQCPVAVFESVNTVIQEVLQLPRRMTVEEQKDALLCRRSSCLRALAAVSCLCPALEKHAIFAMLVPENNFTTSDVCKVLEQLVTQLEYPNLAALVGAHMPYFAHEWLLCKYSLDEFPCRMIGLKTAEDFYRTYQAVLVPAVIMNTDATSLDVIAKVLKISPENLLQQNISKVVVHIFPFFSQAAKNATSEHQVKQAYKCYELVKEFIDEELVEAASNEHLEDIVVDVLLRLQDQELMASSRKWRSLEMAPNSPALSLNMVMSTLEYLTAEGPLVAALGLRQDGMWRVLMSLLQEVFHTHRPHVRLRCLSAFGLFVRQLLKEFHSALSGNCAFVLRSIIHFTLLLLKPADHSDTNLGNYTFDINCLCCDLLTETCAVAVQTQPQDVSRHLSEIVSQILPHAIQENSKFSCKFSFMRAV
ncbi:hypothetical protein CAPTEDRAFT_187870 [Capitella teleta]|uniref:Uncharacterized protein n=1 Tax=Capitella teleta TaxID=283909 RepID=R7VC05_CAPTE|nr:hypothetical protein CAPTEDRAFT_187870 [Capitella teleta]|eukprot:ELU13190.1 hypothetical protein CAPTEDRAFT_187870 [Capitella teleta]